MVSFYKNRQNDTGAAPHLHFPAVLPQREGGASHAPNAADLSVSLRRSGAGTAAASRFRPTVRSRNSAAFGACPAASGSVPEDGAGAAFRCGGAELERWLPPAGVSSGKGACRQHPGDYRHSKGLWHPCRERSMGSAVVPRRWQKHHHGPLSPGRGPHHFSRRHPHIGGQYCRQRRAL